MLVVVTVLCVLLAWKVRQVHRQEVMVAKLLQLGGEVGYNEEYITPYPRAKTTWLHKLLGNAFFDDVTYVYLHSTSVTDDDLAIFGECRSIQGVNLGCTSITDDGLLQLSHMWWLKELHLTRTRVTDAGLVHLRGLHGLQELSLDRESVSAGAVKELRKQLRNTSGQY